MSDLLFTVNAVMPIVFLVLVGYFMKRIGLIDKTLAKGLNKTVFRLFLPVMLFLNVYKIDISVGIDMTYVLFVIAAVLMVFFISIPAISLVTGDSRKKGALLQATFRSNYALIGIPLAGSLFGERGSIVATVLSAFAVPLFNILAIVSLSIFKKDGTGRVNIKKIILGIIKNPLIDAIALGGVFLIIRMVFVRLGVDFRLKDVSWLYDGVLSKLSAVATPLALVALGADFEFSKISSLKREIITGTLIRVVAVPTLAIGSALLIGGFDGAEVASFVAVFATPVAVSSVPMAHEMDADHALAGQLVVFTTVSSAFTIFAITFILRSIGIF